MKFAPLLMTGQTGAGHAAPLVEIKELCVSIGSRTLLESVNLTIEQGELVAVVGRSGSGKSTLCNAVNGTIPRFIDAEVSGSIRLSGQETADLPFADLTQSVNTVFQNPEQNVFGLTGVDDLAFAPENIGLSRMSIADRVAQSADRISLWDLLPRPTNLLSGGQKQRLAIGSCLTLQPALLILDEPTTDLDPAGKEEVVTALHRVRHELGLTMMIVEHDLNNVVGVAERMILMDHGTIVRDASTVTMLTEHLDDLRAAGVRIPRQTDHTPPAPSPDPAATQLREIVTVRTSAPPAGHPRAGTSPGPADRPVLEFSHTTFSYRGRRGEPILRDVSLTIGHGEWVAVLGRNGGGKSTMLRLVTGLIKPTSGSIAVDAQRIQQMRPRQLARTVGYAFQNPDNQLFASSVLQECLFSLRRSKLSEPERLDRVEDVLRSVGLYEQRERHPATLSRGEKRRLAVATTLVQDVKLLLLDEPTTGQDANTLHGLMQIMRRLNQAGTTVMMVTHDTDVVREYCSRVICVDAGRIVLDGTPLEVFDPANEEVLRRCHLAGSMSRTQQSHAADSRAEKPVR